MYFVDLFCGCGGASEGARQAGLRVALAVDSDERALRTHARNHPECRHMQLTLPAELPLPPEPRHVHCSPSCTKVSKGNQDRRGEERERALALIEWSVEYARAHGTTWSLEQVGTPCVIALLRRLGVEFGIFRFDKVGLPQARRRLVAGSPCVLAALRRAEGAPMCSVADVIAACRGTHIRGHACKQAQIRADGSRVYIPRTVSQYARAVDRPSYCVIATNPLRWCTPSVDNQCRNLSVSETAALQSFPADYLVDEKITRAIRQIGNALPPKVARIMFESVAPAGACA